MEVGEDYDEVVVYDISDGSPPVIRVLVFSRDQGSAQYRQTDEFSPAQSVLKP